MSTTSNPRTCAYYVERKSRKCRMLVKAGKKFCGEHSFSDPDNNIVLGNRRIPCPLNKNHTLCEDQLAKHLAKCPSRLRKEEKWFSENLNTAVSFMQNNSWSDATSATAAESAQIDSNQSINRYVNLGKRKLNDVDDLELLELSEKIEGIFESENLSNRIDHQRLTHSVMLDELSNREYSANTLRHLHQAASILGMLEQQSLIGDDTCFVEFGAGKAKLSCWIQKAVVDSKFKRCSFVLLEQTGLRYKAENKCRSYGDNTDDVLETAQFYRIRSAIEHVDLSKMDCIRNAKQVVAFCKHLCGSGTDAAIFSVVNALKSGVSVKAAVLIPCCHHRCSLMQFSGSIWLADRMSTSSLFDVFPILTAMSSWATCGIVLANRQSVVDDNQFGHNVITGDGLKTADSLDPERKEEIGRKCKHVLDAARAEFLKAYGFSTSFHFYVDQTVTPENLMLLATLK